MDFKRQKFFWSRVRKDGEHLIWEGSQTTRGYGKMMVEGENVYAHRVAYCIAKAFKLDEIEHLQIIRTCELNECVEPSHLAAKIKKPKKLKEQII